jgi:ATP-dependent 26S proteasome regulatory subunit
MHTMTNDNELQAHIAELLNALHGYLSMDDVLKQRTAHLPNSTLDPADLRRRARRYSPIAAPVIAKWYEPLTEHVSAILTLTNDKNLRIIVRRLKRLARADVEDRRKFFTQAEETPTVADSVKLLGKAATTAFGMTARRNQIKSAMSELQTFYNSAA